MAITWLKRMLNGKNNHPLNTVNLLKPHRWRLVSYLCLILLSTLFAVASLFSISNFLQVLFGTSAKLLTNKTNGNNAVVERYIYDFYDYIIGFGQMQALLLFAGFVFLLYLFKDIFTYAASYIIATVRNQIVRHLRQILFQKYISLPLASTARYKRGDLLSRISNDIIEFDENVLRSVQQLLFALISTVIYFAALFYIDYRLTFFSLIIVPLISSFAAGIKRKLRRSSVHMQQKTAHILSCTEETIAGLRIIKSHTAISYMNEKYQKFNRSYTRLRNKIYRRVDLASPQSEFLANVLLVSILLVGGMMVVDPAGKLSPEMFMVYLIIFALLINPSKDIAMALHNMKKGKASADRMASILSLNDSILESTTPIAIQKLETSIEYRHVGFSYHSDLQVVKDVSFLIPKGKTVALVGHSGSGKTTLMDLLLRFYDPTQGAIYIDGENIAEYAISDLRGLFGVVSQHTMLFNESIYWNLTLGSSQYSQADVQHAAQMAFAHEFICQLPDGYHTPIGDRGGMLSGGQRQRLSIARALLHKPEILLLDEATSALDTQSERMVQDAIQNAMVGRTSLVIAHRLSTIKNADEILVLDKGEIVQRGTHETLYNDLNGIYRKLCNMQSIS